MDRKSHQDLIKRQSWDCSCPAVPGSLSLCPTYLIQHKGAPGWAGSPCRVNCEGRSAERGLCTYRHTLLLLLMPRSLPRSWSACMPTSSTHSHGRRLLPPHTPSFFPHPSPERQPRWQLRAKLQPYYWCPTEQLIRSELFVPLCASVSLSGMVPTSLGYVEG